METYRWTYYVIKIIQPWEYCNMLLCLFAFYCKNFISNENSG